MADIQDLLPPSLALPPHLSAHKYFFVCTLTVAAWDTLVLSPRTWKLFRSNGWPLLKVLFHFLRIFMPVEFAIVAVAFFDTKFTATQCQHFYLFEPICTAILVSACSLVHLIRVSAIYPSNKAVKYGLSALLAIQVGIMAAMCAFYRPMPLIFPAPPSNSGQGCIAGPKFADREWVGLYWLLPTIFYTFTFGLALSRSISSLNSKQLSYWKLMLRDGLNLYGAIWVVNMVNMLFWFIVTPTDETDTIKTIVSSMAAALTTTMTLRIILSIRGSLGNGGSFSGSNSSSTGATHTGSHSGTRSAAGVRSAQGHGNTGLVSISRTPQPTFTIGNPGVTGVEGEGKGAENWDDGNSNASVPLAYKEASDEAVNGRGFDGVQVRIEQTKHVDGGYGNAR